MVDTRHPVGGRLVGKSGSSLVSRVPEGEGVVEAEVGTETPRQKGVSSPKR